MKVKQIAYKCPTCQAKTCFTFREGDKIPNLVKDYCHGCSNYRLTYMTKNTVEYRITPATNLPDKSKVFVSCDTFDLDPNRCDTIIANNIYDGFLFCVDHANQKKIGEYRIIVTCENEFK